LYADSEVIAGTSEVGFGCSCSVILQADVKLGEWLAGRIWYFTRL
jgi:hypothetical protein